VVRQLGKSKPVVWRWQERFMREGVDGLLPVNAEPRRERQIGRQRDTSRHLMMLSRSTGLLLGVLRHQSSTEGFGQNGLVEFGQEPGCVGVFGGDTVEPCEGGFDAADYLLHFVSTSYGNRKRC
jgi:hypothetical protein